MPIFEFQCEECNAFFEELVREETVVVCPQCGSSKVIKQLSTFSTSDSSDNKTPDCFRGGCGCDLGKCGSGNCGLDN